MRLRRSTGLLPPSRITSPAPKNAALSARQRWIQARLVSPLTSLSSSKAQFGSGSGERRTDNMSGDPPLVRADRDGWPALVLGRPRLHAHAHPSARSVEADRPERV